MESDCVLGHEAAGIVLKVGEGVKDLVVGEFFVMFLLSLTFLFWGGHACVQKKNGWARARKS